MKYSAITNSVKQALGLPDADDARLLSELNMVRLEVCARTDWDFLRLAVSAAVSDGTPLAVDGSVLGVTLVTDSAGRVYYHTSGMVPANTGRRFWTWQRRAAAAEFARAIVAYDDTGTAAATTLTAHYWTAPAELTSATLATTEVEFPGVAAFISGLHGRWLRYQELKAEAAGPYEQQFAADLGQMAQVNPRGIEPPPFTVGGVLYSTGDRTH